jgi:hypothetical protein
MQRGEVLSAGMCDIENVLVFYYTYFGDVCIKVVGQIELERDPKKWTIIRHGIGTKESVRYFFQNIRFLCETFLGAFATL